MLKRFTFRGGVHPRPHKHLSSHEAIRSLPLPKRLYVPLQQHIGAPAEAVVQVGERVLKGQLLGRGNGRISAPVHAPSSGTVAAITAVTAPHVSALAVLAVVVETDGEDRWLETPPLPDPFSLPPEEVANQVAEAGIVGMGGATFPAAVKLRTGLRTGVRTLLLNGAECEPFLTCDDRLMQEMPEQVVDGARIMGHALQARNIMIVVEGNKPEALAALRNAARAWDDVSIVAAPTRYPMGSEKQMIQAVVGQEVPAGALGADIGVLVHNVGTAHAVHQALRQGRPLVTRIVTVTGEAVSHPRNLEVPVGTHIEELLRFCGGSQDNTARLLMGGPMMGQEVPSLQVPVVKGMNGIVALSPSQIQDAPQAPCIRCGRCVDACPIGLLPLEMSRRVQHDDLQGALDFGLIDCITCGSCAYACPARIPLVQYFRYARDELTARQRAEQKTKETRRLMEQREARIERQKRAQAEAAARRKAERLAKKQARAKAGTGVSA